MLGHLLLTSKYETQENTQLEESFVFSPPLLLARLSSALVALGLLCLVSAT